MSKCCFFSFSKTFEYRLAESSGKQKKHMDVTFLVPICNAVLDELKDCFNDENLAVKAGHVFEKVYNEQSTIQVLVRDVEWDSEMIREDEYSEALTGHVAYYYHNALTPEHENHWLAVQFVQVTFKVKEMDEQRTNAQGRPCLRVLRDGFDDLLDQTVTDKISYIGLGSLGQFLVVWVS